MNILLIEDNEAIAGALKVALRNEHNLDHTSSGTIGVSKLLAATYDVVVLDLQLPDISGLTVCQQIRSNDCQQPILILTAESTIMSKINLLDAGADDYLTKPFSLGELKARLRTLRRRVDTLQQQPNITIGAVTLNHDTKLVSRSGVVVHLRRKEFIILECLMRHADTAVSRELLAAYAWHGQDDPWTNTIDVHIKYLRDKFDRPFNLPCIKTVHGIGYKFDSSNARSHDAPSRQQLQLVK